MSKQGRGGSDSREWYEGWHEVTVRWLEVQDGTVALREVEKTFVSLEESVAFLQERVDGGWVYDMVSSHEVILGGKGHPRVPVLTAEEWAKRIGLT